ncbi:MAG: rhomboid family intramembrane serine protease [Anaerolineae bacterium]|nr:rhomboid family intramembrane serine protease [Phycisphaerae bacterium]
MLFPLRTDVPLRYTPWMNWALILLNVLMYIVQVQQGPEFTQRFALNPRNAQLYQYCTYAFLHGSVMHLAGNMLFLYIFGNNINDRLGHIGYLGFYLAGGVMAGVAHVIVSDGSVLGASGAVAAITGAFLILFPRARVTIVYFFILIGVAEIASLWFVGAFFLMDVFFQVSGSSGVAHMAHIGGSVFGAGVCLLMLRLRLLPRNQWDVLALIDRWNRRRQYRDIVASGYDPFAYATRKAAHDPKQDRIIEIRAAIAESMAHSNLPEAVKGFMELRAVDPAQVLSRQNQLDMANYLYEQDLHAAAADAYEGYLRVYPKADQVNHVTLILGLLYSRYLNRPDRAEQFLKQVIERLHEGKEVELARAELAKVTGNAPI